jgi:hypothetical protein
MPGGIGLATHQLRDNGFLKVGRQQILWVRVFCGDGDGQRGKVFCQTARNRDPGSACKRDPFLALVQACPGRSYGFDDSAQCCGIVCQ